MKMYLISPKNKSLYNWAKWIFRYAKYEHSKGFALVIFWIFIDAKGEEKTCKCNIPMGDKYFCEGCGNKQIKKP